MTAPYRQLTYQNQSIDNWFGTGNTACAAGQFGTVDTEVAGFRGICNLL
jgi:hypothetical protein